MHQHMKWHEGLDKPDKYMHDHEKITDTINDVTEINNDKKQKA